MLKFHMKFRLLILVNSLRLGMFVQQYMSIATFLQELAQKEFLSSKHHKDSGLEIANQRVDYTSMN